MATKKINCSKINMKQAFVFLFIFFIVCVKCVGVEKPCHICTEQCLGLFLSQGTCLLEDFVLKIISVV